MRSTKAFPSIVALCVMSLALTACAGLQNAPAKPSTPRDEAIQKYAYSGKKDEIFAETPLVVPSVAAAGATISQTYRFAVLSPDAAKRFQVHELAVLTGKDISVDLSKKVMEKTQGTHTSTLRIGTPRDLPPGHYQIITVISIDGSVKKLLGSFAIRK